jgi:rod shape-determining protein MreC
MLAVLLSIAALALIATRFGRGPGLGQGAAQSGDDAAVAAGQVATGPFRAAENLFERLGAMWNASGRIAALEAEKRELEAWRELAERLAERNRRYEALLRMPADSLGEGADIDRAIAAQLVLDSGGPFTRTLVANAGADHGVRVGYIAVNENGLVGRVVSVGRRSARVLMLDDYNSRIPVMGEASRVRAVMAGQANQAPELLTGPFEVQSPRLDFIVGAQSLREGERIVTSGDGGLYPRGLPVGEARRGGDGQWRVALAVSRRPVDFVRLIPFVGAPRPEDEPVADAGPPLSTQSSVATVSRETTPPPPERPIVSLSPPAAPVQTRVRAQAAAPAEAPAAPVAEQPAAEAAPSALGPPPEAEAAPPQ